MTPLTQKVGILVVLTLLCVVMALSTASATEDLVPYFTRDGAFDFFCPSAWMVAGEIRYVYADVDEDPGTGSMYGGEVMVVVAPIAGSAAIALYQDLQYIDYSAIQNNCGLVDDCDHRTGYLWIRFVDYDQPGFLINDMNTWVEANVGEVHVTAGTGWDADMHGCDPRIRYSYFKAYNHYGGGGQLDHYDLAPDNHVYSFILDDPGDGISEVLVRTDYTENGIWELALFPYECCEIRGDVNHSGARDIVDLTSYVEFMFHGGPAAPCPEEADINGDGSHDISDLVYYVDFMFVGGPEPPPCP